jgi:RHS repeat-associated protein
VTYNYAADTNIHLRSLPTQRSVYDASGTEASRTTYDYDDYPNGITAYTDIVGRADGFGHTYFTRGNVTQVTQWLLPSTALATQMTYDVAGNVLTTTDAKGNTTTFNFADHYGTPDSEARSNTRPVELSSGEATYAVPTQVIGPAPSSFISYLQYDYYLGLPVNKEDANGVISKARYGGYEDLTYTDALDRPTELVVAVNTTVQRRSRIQYLDAQNTVSTVSDQTSFTDGLLHGESVYDGFGRTVQARQYVPDTGSYVVTAQSYDAMGRQRTASNPYRPGNAADPVVYTTTDYDALGRVFQVTMPDNAVVTTSYLGNQTTVTDQAGKKRRSISDGLGRMTQVDELYETGTLYASTLYTYDALDQLVRVQQGSQNRYFKYDSLKRLIRARNPEQDTHPVLAMSDALTGNSQWSIGYSYDANGNLSSKTDSRDKGQQQLLHVDYTYDELNRITTRSYFNDPQSTPTVTYTYDDPLISASKGRLTKVSSSVSAYDYLQFDLLGRVLQSRQTTSGTGQSYTIGYQYNLAGAMTQETYPSGRVVNTSYDSAGRIDGISGGNTNLGETTRQYLSQISYAAHGAMKSALLGNNKWEHTTFNTRLQPTQIGLGTSATDSSLLRLDYTYGVRVNGVLDTTKNNDNVESQTIAISQPSWSVTQSYTYDQVNRLSQASESGSTTPWQQSYLYDAYGNRAVSSASTYIPTPRQTQVASSLSDLPTLFGQSSNRIIATSEYGYDAAGNQTKIPTADASSGYDQMSYDGENRQVSYTKGGQTTYYSYDGDGRRVKKQNPDNSIVVYVYNVSGQLITEYDSTTAATTQPYQTSYLTADHLGSTRVVTDSGGSVKTRRDYLPFGQEIQSGYGGRTTGMKYALTDGLRQQFTAKERDSESGLDYFGARYYSGAQGRFISTDPLLASGTTSDPQSWNRFSYALCNPLKYIDPTGLYVYADGTSDPQKRIFERALRNLRRARDYYRQGTAEYARLDRALNAYGADGVNNGVTIKFGPAETPGHTVVSFNVDETGNNKKTTNENPTGQNITVTIDPSRNSNDNDFAFTVAHEGSHVADGSDLVGALPKNLTNLFSSAPLVLNDETKNLRTFATEYRAYETESFAAQALTRNQSLGIGSSDEKYQIWSSGWAEADRARKRTAGIIRVLARPKSEGGRYEVSPFGQGRKFIQ